jgi:hypothetical protein
VHVTDALEAAVTVHGDLANITLLTLVMAGGKSVPVMTSCLLAAL